MKGGSAEERANAADSYISYSGPCEIEKDKFRVKVEVSLFPNWVGGIQERNYKIEEKTLSVSTTPTLVNGKEQVGYLIFERVWNWSRAHDQAEVLKPQDPKPVSWASSRLRKLLKHYYAYHTFWEHKCRKKKNR